LIRHTRIKNNKKNNIESAAKLDLTIIGVPIRYRERTYGKKDIQAKVWMIINVDGFSCF
jgi:hypothetical protein